MTPRIVNLTTGQITPLQVVWSDTDHTPTCECCGTYEPFCTCEPDSCLHCNEPLRDIDEDDILCDNCIERLANAMIDDWLNRSHEAQDRAVLRGWG